MWLNCWVVLAYTVTPSTECVYILFGLTDPFKVQLRPLTEQQRRVCPAGLSWHENLFVWKNTQYFNSLLFSEQDSARFVVRKAALQ